MRFVSLGSVIGFIGFRVYCPVSKEIGGDIKLLTHDGAGWWPCSKRLDAGTLTWPASGTVDPLTAVQLWALIVGLEVCAGRFVDPQPLPLRRLPPSNGSHPTAWHASDAN